MSISASYLKLTVVVGSAPVSALRHVEEQAANVYGVAVHPALGTASTLKYKVKVKVDGVMITNMFLQ